MKTSTGECVLALDAGGTTIKAALVTPENELLDFFETPVTENGTAADILISFEAAGATGASMAAKRGLSLRGIGVGIPGPFDYKEGISLMTHKYAAIRGLPLRPYIAHATPGIPVRFMHDSSAFLLGEMAVRAAQTADICAVLIGTGLGFACTKGGSLYQNESGGPGISIFRRPFRGETAEDFVSKRGIMRAYANLGGSAAKSVKDVAEFANAGDTAARQAFWDTGEAVCEILAPILLEDHFACMILGGQIAKAGPLLSQPIQNKLDQLGVPCLVETALRIDDAPLLGAARLIP